MNNQDNATFRPTRTSAPASLRPALEPALDIAYEVSGPLGKPVLLLIHGGTASLRAWDLVTPALRVDFRVVAVDLRGHGQSPAPHEGYAAAQLSADVARVIDHLGVEQVTVVGHSLGGMAAVLLAASRPDVIARLVLINVPVQPGRINALASVMERVRRPGFFPLTPQFIDEWASHPRPVPEAFLANQRAHLKALPPFVWRQTFGELANSDITAGSRSSRSRP